MPTRKLNVLTCELDASLDEGGFRHDGAAIGHRIGAQRIGAGVYEAAADHPIWPYHYHYSTEEWMYVLSGSPVLRDPGGRRALRSGDVVCFPTNHQGAHTVCGPGRLIIFSTNESPGPWVSVYPDSDKIGISPGLREASGLNALRLPRSGAVDYWHGEGTAEPPSPGRIEREPTGVSSRPVINALSLESTESLGRALGGAGLGVTVMVLRRGVEPEPYHWTYGREEWALVLAGSITLRAADGEEKLQAGDVVCFPEGPPGAHRLANHGGGPARVMLLSTQGLPANVRYPDSGTWVLHNGPGAPSVTLGEPPGSPEGQCETVDPAGSGTGTPVA